MYGMEKRKPLTPREIAVLEGMSRGLGPTEIAQKLGTRELLISNTKQRLVEKLRLLDTKELNAKAMELLDAERGAAEQ